MTVQSPTPLILAIVAVLATGATHAEELKRGQSVADRDRPELNAQGVRTGAFRWFPAVGLEVGYVDNIFATRDDEVDDVMTIARPKLVAESDWGRHYLAAGVDGAIGRYNDFDSEDYEDWWAWTGGRVDMNRSQLQGEVRVGNRHNPRASANDRGGNAGLELTTYDVAALKASWTFKPGRAFLRVDGDYETRTYDDNVRPDGNGNLVTLDNAHRDRTRTSLGLRAGMEVTPDYNLFVEGRLKDLEYDQQYDLTCLGNDPDDPASWCERSFDGWSLTAGSMLDFSGDLFGEFYLGYRSNDYDDPRFGKQDGPTYGLALTWNLTGLTSLKLSGDQSVAATTIIGSSGIDRSSLGIRADHELLRRLLVNAGLRWTRDDFQNIDRTDEIVTVTVGAKYMFNRNFELSLGYDYNTSDTSPAAAGGLVYDVSRVFAELKGKL